MTLQELLPIIETKAGFKPIKRGSGWSARCPAHEDKAPSLSVSEGRAGRILLKCHAGCSFESITAALGIPASELAGKNSKPSLADSLHAARKIVASYDYRDEKGKLLFQVCRFDPKDFRQRREDKSALGCWAWKTTGVRRVLYRLPELLAGVKAGQTVFIAEGEKDCEALAKAGFVATCNPGGAGKWRDDFCEPLRGAAVVIIADKDEPGRAHANAVAAKLKLAARTVKVLELPDVETKPVKDAADFLAAGGTAETLRALADKTPEYVLKAELTPTTWFKQRFPGLAEKHGEPVALSARSGNRPSVQDLNESFMAATLSAEACPKAPTIFIRPEGRFYAYHTESGIYAIAGEEDLAARLSDTLLTCARDCREACDVSALEFNFRDSASLAGTVKRAKATLAAPDDFFKGGMEEFLPVGNGVLRIADRTLLPFSPDYRRRNKLAVDYKPAARCPLFLDTLLRTSLEEEDIGLLQRWCGLALVGRNIAQRILILSGTAGAGKGCFVRVLKGVIGEANIGSLRTEMLNDRFEIGRLLNKTLLYGADVPSNFLSCGSASILKSLTGGDPVTVEFKNSMESPSLTCEFNVITTSNSRLTVHLEGDVGAWQRRLAIVRYERPRPANLIPDLDARIVAQEGPGVLNWMLDGLYALRAANWQLSLSPRQQARVDELLLESDSVNVFFRERCIADTAAPGITVSDTFVAFCDFCMDRGWNPIDRYAFGREAPDSVQRTFRLAVCHRIKGADGKAQRGWQRFRLRDAGESAPD